jgi:hypothetical protein
MEYRVYAALLLDDEFSEGKNGLPDGDFRRADPNRLRTGLQTNASVNCFLHLRSSASIAVQILQFPDAQNFKSEKKSPV